MKVTLEISQEQFAFAEEMAKELGYEGSTDFLTAVLNTAVMLEMDHVHDIKRGAVEKMFEEDEGGGMRFIGDLDDVIRF
jgi:hypothetical protein